MFRPHSAYGDLHEPLQRELAQLAGHSLDVSFTVRSFDIANATADRPITQWKVVMEAQLSRS